MCLVDLKNAGLCVCLIAMLHGRGHADSKPVHWNALFYVTNLYMQGMTGKIAHLHKLVYLLPFILGHVLKYEVVCFFLKIGCEASI